MEHSCAPDGRREFLSLVAGAGTAALAGCTTALSITGRSDVRTATASTTVGPDTGGLTGAEREQYVDRMAERYGSWAADDIVPDATSLDQSLQPGIASGDVIWDGEQTLAVTDSSGTTLAESDNYAAIYESEQSTSLDEDVYVYWLWSCTRLREADELRGLWSHVDVSGGGDVLVYDPGGDVTDNGTIRPHPEKTGQDTDEFAVQWQGEHDGTQVVTGSLSERRGDGDARGFEWTVHLACDGR